ncbi:MAG: TIM barrel protein [Planctomycetota bacterium]
MLALSSSFLTPGPLPTDHPDSGDDPTGTETRVRRFLEFGPAGGALQHPATAAELRAFGAAFASEQVSWVALHNGTLRRDEHFDSLRPRPYRAPSLSSLDGTERRAAIDEAATHLEWCETLECARLVVRPGRIHVAWDRDGWAAAYDRGEWRHGGRWVDAQAEHTATMFAKRRAEASPRAIDALLSSLDELLNRADGVGVRLALENPRRGDELGTPDEFEQIFGELRGAPLGAWYDVGHAEILEQLGLVDPPALRRRLEPEIDGVTITDVVGRTDGLPPGEGWTLLPIALPPLFDRDRDENPPLSLRCGRGTEPERIHAAIERLRNDGFDGPPPEVVEPFPIIGG